jgi:hypothetical protein
MNLLQQLMFVAGLVLHFGEQQLDAGDQFIKGHGRRSPD